VGSSDLFFFFFCVVNVIKLFKFNRAQSESFFVNDKVVRVRHKMHNKKESPLSMSS